MVRFKKIKKNNRQANVYLFINQKAEKSRISHLNNYFKLTLFKIDRNNLIFKLRKICSHIPTFSET